MEEEEMRNISKHKKEAVKKKLKKFKIPLDISTKYAIIQKLSDSEQHMGV